MQTSWVGGGSVPIRIAEKRYLMIYHTGNYQDQNHREYDLDAAVLDFNRWNGKDPRDLVKSRLEHLMVPETEAELRSHSRLQVANVLFACGSYLLGEDVYIIYGGADTYTLASRANWQELLSALDASGLQNPFA